MNCTKCGSEIPRGETHVAITRRIQCEPFPGVVEVADAVNVATYHLTCDT